MKILAINPAHNGSICYLEDGEVKLYIEEERLTRIKYSGNPILGLDKVMELTDEIDFLILGGAVPIPQVNWEMVDVFTLYLQKHPYFNSNFKTIFADHMHHFTHATSAFYNSGFESAVAVIVDGCGSYDYKTKEWESETIFHCTPQGNFTPLWTNKNTPNNIGIVKTYEAVTEHCGWNAIEAGKTMGLASYGNHSSNAQLYNENGPIFENFISRFPAGANLLAEKFDINLPLEDKIYLAATIQQDTTNAVIKLIEKAVHLTNETNVVIAGGYGLNCVANNEYLKRLPNLNIYIDPVSHDGGTTFGMAKQLYVQENLDHRFLRQDSYYLGPIHEIDLSGEKCDYVTPKDVAQYLVNGKIIAIYQGRSEAGPRALGNRSILFDPRVKNGKDIINEVKHREYFRPFAASCLESQAHKFFDLRGLKSSPHMMYALDVLQPEKIPAVTHVDCTCRVQTVNEKQNKHYYNLINEFYNLTGIPMVLNTSFNLAGEPLVETPQDAYKTASKSKIDAIYFPELESLIWFCNE